MFNTSRPRRGCRAVLFLLWLPAASVHGDTAKMLPAGMTHLRYQYTVGEADKVFDAGGDRVSLARAYRDALDTAGLTTEVPAVYRVDTDGRLALVRHDLYLEYGLTDAVNFGLWTHYVSQRLDYSAALVRAIGWGALIPAQQAALEGAVAGADGTADRSVSALGDTVLGIKHRPLGSNASALRFAYIAGLRLPTGHMADPLKAHDISVGDGQTDVGLWFMLDWEPDPHWFFNLHTRHEYALAGEREVLNPADPDDTLPMEFQPGIFHRFEFWVRYREPGPRFNSFVGLKTIYETEGEERRQSYDPVRGGYHGDLDAVEETDSALLRLEPEIGINLFPSRIPIALKLYGGIPLRGRNSVALEYVGLRFDAYW